MDEYNEQLVKIVAPFIFSVYFDNGTFAEISVKTLNELMNAARQDERELCQEDNKGMSF